MSKEMKNHWNYATLGNQWSLQFNLFNLNDGKISSAKI